MSEASVSPSHLRLRSRPLRVLGDDRLAGLAARGDEAAFGAIYERHLRPLHRYCTAILGNSEDANDCLQNTMLKAFEALRSSSRDIALEPWLFRIAHNEAISLLRRRRPSADVDESDLGPSPGADADAVTRERIAQLFDDLAQLPDRQRGALVLRELNGVSMEALAAWLGTSAASARQVLFEARTALHELAEGRDMAHAKVREAVASGDRRRLAGRKVQAHLRACPECRTAAERAGLAGDPADMDHELVRQAISDADGGRPRNRAARAHLKGCESCQDFQALIAARGVELRALAPPLPAAAAAALFSSFFGGGGGAGGLGAGAAGGGLFGGELLGGAAGAKSVGALVAALVIAGAVGGPTKVAEGGADGRSGSSAEPGASEPQSAPPTSQLGGEKPGSAGAEGEGAGSGRDGTGSGGRAGDPRAGRSPGQESRAPAVASAGAPGGGPPDGQGDQGGVVGVSPRIDEPGAGQPSPREGEPSRRRDEDPQDSRKPEAGSDRDERRSRDDDGGARSEDREEDGNDAVKKDKKKKDKKKKKKKDKRDKGDKEEGDEKEKKEKKEKDDREDDEDEADEDDD